MEYDLGFAKRLAEIALATANKADADGLDRRAAAYMARLGMELALKSMLEVSGMSIRAIRDMSHDLCTLMAAVDRCEVRAAEGFLWQSASRLRGLTITAYGGETTVGQVIEAERYGASRYPVELRYGALPKDFPPDVIALATLMVVEEAMYWGANIRPKPIRMD